MKKSNDAQKNHEAFLIALENTINLTNAEQKQKPFVGSKAESFNYKFCQN